MHFHAIIHSFLRELHRPEITEFPLRRTIQLAPGSESEGPKGAKPEFMFNHSLIMFNSNINSV